MPTSVVLAALVAAATVAAAQGEQSLSPNATSPTDPAVTLCGTVYGATTEGSAPHQTAVLHLGDLEATPHPTPLTGGRPSYVFVTIPHRYWTAAELQREFILKHVCATATVETSDLRRKIVVRDVHDVRVTEPIPMADAHWPWEAGIEPPKLVRDAKPYYTAEALRAKVDGVVVLVAIIRPDGQAHDIRVVQPLGFGLDEAAVSCLRQWRFIPGKFDGEPAAVTATFELEFRQR